MSGDGFGVSAECDWFLGGRPALPEENLMMAVFHRAVLDAVLVVDAEAKGSLRVIHPEVRRSAESYLFAPVPGDESPFRLEAVADHLGVGADELRARLRAIVAAGRAGSTRLRRSRMPGEHQDRRGFRSATDELVDAVRVRRPGRPEERTRREELRARRPAAANNRRVVRSVREGLEEPAEA